MTPSMSPTPAPSSKRSSLTISSILWGFSGLIRMRQTSRRSLQQISLARHVGRIAGFFQRGTEFWCPPGEAILRNPRHHLSSPRHHPETTRVVSHRPTSGANRIHGIATGGDYHAHTSRFRHCFSYPGRIRLDADFLLRSDCSSGRKRRPEGERGHLRDATEYHKSSGGEATRHDIRLLRLIDRKNCASDHFNDDPVPAGTGSLLNQPVRLASASGMTCSRGAGPTESSPMKGRS